MTNRATNAGHEPLIGGNDLPRFPIVWVGILIAAALLIVAGSFIWAASKSDNLSLARQSDTIDQAIEQQGAAFARELKVQTVWSEGYDKTKAPDKEWMHEFYGAYLTNLLGYEGIYVLDGSDQPVYGYRNGEDVGPAAFDTFMPDISDLVAKLRHPEAGKSVRYNLIETPLTLDGRAVTHRAIADMRNIQGKPAIVVISTILPDVYPPDGIISPPFLLVAVYRADPGFISLLGSTFGFAGLRWLDGAADAATSTKVVKSSLGTPVGVLGWRRDEPGRQFFRRVIAGLLTALLLLLSLAALLIRISKRQTERIVANAAEARLLARIAAEAQHLARTDALTGLPNRFALDEALSERAGDHAGPAAVMFMDLDGFKEINDSHGHAIGDQLIVAFAGFLKRQLPEGAILARIGGDEFAVVLPSDHKESTARNLAEKVLGFVAEPFEIDQRFLPIGVSIGIALRDAAIEEGRELLRRADLAMYAAKARGKACYVVFNPEMDLSRQARQEIANDLRQALDRNEFDLAYQPIVDAGSRAIVGVEALLRWPRGPRDDLRPDHFIPIAEETGLIDAIGLWVLKRACVDALAWRNVELSVNVSPAQLRDPNFAEKVDAILAETGFPAERLNLEITEGYLIQHRDRARHIIEEIKRRGVTISLDDFGTGYASIGYLRDFGFDCLKLDRTITATAGVKGPAAAVLHATIAFAQVLSMRVIAEGVETEAQAALLSMAGCDQLQGFLLGGPQPLSAIAELLRRAEAVAAKRAKAAA